MDLLLIDDSECDIIHQVLAEEFRRTCCSFGSEIVYILDELEVAKRLAGVH
jgi:hypothetical protein